MKRSRTTPILAAALVLAATLLASAAPAAKSLALDAPTTPILDNFNRPDETPLSGGGNWTGEFSGVTDPLKLVSNEVAGQNSVTSDSYWVAQKFGVDQEAYATVRAKPAIAGDSINVPCRIQEPSVTQNSWDGYELLALTQSGTDTLLIRRVTNDGMTVLVSTSLEFAVGDRLWLRCAGSTLTASIDQGAGFTQILQATDSVYVLDGWIGLRIRGTTGRADDFGGGNLVAPPSGAPPAAQCNGILGGGRGVLAICPSVTLFDPVNTFTGAFMSQVEDLSLPGTGVSFAWTRSYTSADATVGPLGPGWTHTYAASLAVQPNGDVLAHGDEGQQVFFTKQPNGSFVGAAGARATLTSVAGGYKLVRTDQVTYLFDTQGRLTSMKDRNDQGLTFTYDGSGRLATITDAAGRPATVSYNASSLVSSVSTHGRSVSYGYTGGLLSSVTDVRGKTWSYTYEASGKLATIVDPLNHTQVTNVYGADGRVQTQTDAVGKTTTFAFDPATQLATVTDANGKVWKDDYASNILDSRTDPLNEVTQFGHDADLNATSVKSPTLEQTTMTYDAAGNMLQATAPASLGSVQKTFLYNARNDPTQITDARSKVTSYTYDTSGNTSTVTQDGTQVGSYTYDPAGRVLTFTDGNSTTTTYTYDTNGNLASQTDPLGKTTTYNYDAAGRVLTRVNPKGNEPGANPHDFTWTYTYNAAGQVLTETDPLGNVTTHTYDDAGNELTVTDANLKTTTYAYDNANRLLSLTAPDTGVTSYTYDNVGNKLTETDPLNHVTTSTYDSANRLASTTTASGAKTTFFYDANGNLTKQVEPRGNVGGGVNPDDYATTFSYDAAGRLLTETDPLGNVTTHTYDAVGNELTLKDANNKTTTYAYDGKNRLATVTAPDGGVTTYTYDPVGNKLTEKDPRNDIATFTYDDANRLASLTKPSGGKTTYAYDANGNRTSMVEPRGNVTGCGCASQFTWTYAFDRANRKLSETSPLGHVTSFAYDSVGNQLTVTDANTHATAYTYDAVNRLKTVTAPDLGVTTHTYDLAGNLTQRQDARNNVTSYGYDVDNRRTSVTNPLSKLWATTYDPAGNVLTTVDANGNATPTGGDGTTTYNHDRAGRLTGIDYSDTTPDVTYTYDAAGNRLSMADDSGTESRTYDPVNRLASVTRGTDTFSYAYDLAGNLTSRTYPGSVVTAYTYDVDDRLATAVNASLTTSYAYDPAGNLLSTTLPSANGYIETRVYDPSGRLTEVTNQKGASLLSRFAIARDPVSNPTSVDRTGALVQAQTYTYDVNDRISTVCFAASCTPTSPDRIAWTYDLVGNRLSETRLSGTTSSTYNAGDQLLTAGSTSYTYDSNGNELSAGSRTFSYDLGNRLKTTTQGNTTTTYAYDGDGVRLQASTGTHANMKTNFLWDVSHPLPQVALERDGAGALQRQYVYGLRRIRQSAGTQSYYHYDGLGSVANLTSSSGATQWTWSYEPFGSIRTETKASGNQPDNFLKFTGEYLDPTGLYHLRARQYDPAIGRFLRLDPAEPSEADPTVSAYTYVANRPTVLVDPRGTVFEPSDDGQVAAQEPTSPADVDDAWPKIAISTDCIGSRTPSSVVAGPRFKRNCERPLTGPRLRNARRIWTLALNAGIKPNRAREMVAAACQESLLEANTENAIGAKGLFQLLVAPYLNRVERLGDWFDPRDNTCAILWNYKAYWDLNPGAPAGLGASKVEESDAPPEWYAAPLRTLRPSFTPIAVKRCPKQKPICAKYFVGTRFDGPPNCSVNG